MNGEMVKLLDKAEMRLRLRLRLRTERSWLFIGSWDEW